jgi:hypothetical protein
VAPPRSRGGRGMRSARVGLLTSLLLGAVVGQALRGQDAPGAAVVQSMHDMYAGKWYRTLTFVQTTTRRLKDGRDSVMTWYESASLPGTLRIDIGSPKDGNGVLYTADSTFRFKNGALVSSAAGGNVLLTMAFDVYVQPVPKTLAVLKAMGVDLSKVHRETWDGRPVTVIGAESGDTRSTQFWIDRDRLVVLRQLSVLSASDPRQLDARFGDMRKAGGGWVAANVQLYIDGALVQREAYGTITADPSLSSALFDPRQWSTAPHWTR